MERKWSTQQTAIFDWFAGHQYAVMGIDVNGHIIVRARAGTGKTTVIIEGVKRAPERSILVAAFSKIIQLEADSRFMEMNPRLNKMERMFPHIKVQTLHSVGFACIRKFRDRIQVEFSSGRADALTEAVAKNAPDTIKRQISKLHTKGREIAPHATKIGDLTDIAITFDCEPEEMWAKSGYDLNYIEKHALEAMELASNIQAGDIIDGSDMIFLPVRNGWLTGQYDLVVIDEAQDMTVAQLEIAQGVLNSGGRIAVVGDNRQAIFGFRGADSESLDRLKGELKAGELGLTTTYRCGKVIVQEAQRLVEDFEAGEGNPEGLITQLNIRKLVDEAGPGNFILSRANAPLVSIAMQLLKRGKRTKIAGRDIGKGLISLVRKLKGNSIPDFLRKVENWETRELSRLQTQFDNAPLRRRPTFEMKMEGVRDQAEMLLSLAEGAKNVQDVVNNIEKLFAEEGGDASSVVTCSSVHRAKGLEAEKVFILRDTIRYHNQEEANIEYVAITRAKLHLVWVSEKYQTEENEEYVEN